MLSILLMFVLAAVSQDVNFPDTDNWLVHIPVDGKDAQAAGWGIYAGDKTIIDEKKIRLAAKKIHARAMASEASVTHTLKGVAGANGGKMQGLDYRLKGLEGVESKLKRFTKVYGMNWRHSKKASFDALRYTVELPDGQYTKGYEKTMAALKKKGFKPARVVNFWEKPGGYKGINTVMKGPNGVLVEVQFHTPESFNLKQGKMHELYEKFRVSTDPKVKAQLSDEMNKLAEAIKKPKQVASIKSKGIIGDPRTKFGWKMQEYRRLRTKAMERVRKAAEKAKVGKAASKGARGAKIAAKAAGKALLIAQAGYVAIECSKDIVEMRNLAKKGTHIPKELWDKVKYCATDLLLGRGSTKAIVETCFTRGEDDTRNGGEKALECLAGAGSIAKALVVDLPAAIMKGTYNCLKEGNCRQKIGAGLKKAGLAIKTWGKTTINVFYQQYKESRDRKRYCSSSPEAKAECEEEDAAMEANSAKVWAKWREDNKFVKFVHDAGKSIGKGMMDLYKRGKEVRLKFLYKAYGGKEKYEAAKARRKARRKAVVEAGKKVVKDVAKSSAKLLSDTGKAVDKAYKAAKDSGMKLVYKMHGGKAKYEEKKRAAAVVQARRRAAVRRTATKAKAAVKDVAKKAGKILKSMQRPHKGQSCYKGKGVCKGGCPSSKQVGNYFTCSGFGMRCCSA